MITSYAVGWNAGQNLILENVSGMADRLLPFGSNTLSLSVERPHAGGNPITAVDIDEILGFTDTEGGNLFDADSVGGLDDVVPDNFPGGL